MWRILAQGQLWVKQFEEALSGGKKKKKIIQKEGWWSGSGVRVPA
jgi:hypothetical protein